jgi:hypothetical protein
MIVIIVPKLREPQELIAEMCKAHANRHGSTHSTASLLVQAAYRQDRLGQSVLYERSFSTSSFLLSAKYDKNITSFAYTQH